MLLLILLTINLVNANGLKIEPTSITLNKTFDIDKSINIVIKNEEPFDFYNITFQPNPTISIARINRLEFGQSVNITAIIKTNSDVSDVFKIRGYYEAKVGEQNKTHQVIIDDDGLTPCDLTIVKGDKVKWNNFFGDDVTIKDEATGLEVAIILEGQNYTKEFNFPGVFNYIVYRGGFSPINPYACTITIQDDFGQINDPNLDGVFGLDVNVEFLKTDIQVTLLENNYSMDNYEDNEGVMTIKNIGNNPVKELKLSGDWFSFSPNNFDINVGSTKVITYTINKNKPGLLNSNDTNKTYIKNIIIQGNFEKVIKDLSIFIKYGDISNSSYTSGQNIADLINTFCEENPDTCYKERIVYRNVGNGTKSFNVTYTTEMVKGMTDLQFDVLDTFDDYIKDRKIKDSNNDLIVNKTDSEISILSSNVQKLINTMEEESTNYTFGFLIFFIAVTIVLLSMIALLYKRKKDIEKLNY